MQNGIYWIGSCESNINYSYKGKKKINIVLKSETTQLFWDTYFFANDSVIIERREYIELNWIMPQVYWMKCNIDGVSWGSLSVSTKGGFFNSLLGILY